MFVETVPATMLKEALAAFAATITLFGTLAAAALLLVRATCAPPDGAAASSVTVADFEAPDEMVAEVVTDCTARALVVPELLLPPLPEPVLLFEEPLFEPVDVVLLFEELLEAPGDPVKELPGEPAQLERNDDARIAAQIPSAGSRICSTPFN